MIFSAWRLNDRKFFLNFSSSSIRTKNEVSSCKNLCIFSFLSLNTWITKYDKKDYEDRQVDGLQKGRLQSAIGFGLLSVTEWVTKCDKMIYKVRQGLQSARGLLKGNGSKPPVYIHCLTVQSIIISTVKVLYEKSFFNDWYHSQWIYNSRHYSRHFHIYILDKCSTRCFTVPY